MDAKKTIQKILIGGGRGGGRTTAAVKVAMETDGAVLVVATNNQREELTRKYPGLNVVTLADVEFQQGRQPLWVVDHFALEMLYLEREREMEIAMNKLRG